MISFIILMVLSVNQHVIAECAGLFLDLSSEILQNNTAIPCQRWNSEYTNALDDRRFGDAIWARYHLAGDVQNQTGEGETVAVLERIKADALKYRVSTPEQYTDALLLYTNTSVEDQYTDVLDMIKRIGRQNNTETKAELGPLVHGLYAAIEATLPTILVAKPSLTICQRANK